MLTKVTRLDAQKYSIARDTIVYFINFDLWGVEPHPQGAGVHNLKEHVE